MEVLRETLAIVLVLALLAAARWALRRSSWRMRPGSPAIESRGKLALTARHSVHLIRIGDRNLILALHPDGIAFLGDGEPENREAVPATACAGEGAVGAGRT